MMRDAQFSTDNYARRLSTVDMPLNVDLSISTDTG